MVCCLVVVACCLLCVVVGCVLFVCGWLLLSCFVFFGSDVLQVVACALFLVSWLVLFFVCSVCLLLVVCYWSIVVLCFLRVAWHLLFGLNCLSFVV